MVGVVWEEDEATGGGEGVASRAGGSTEYHIQIHSIKPSTLYDEQNKEKSYTTYKTYDQISLILTSSSSIYR